MLALVFIRRHWLVFAIAAALALTYAKGRQDGAGAEKRAEAHRLERARAINEAAKDTASTERVRDTAKVSEHHKELTDADNATPDSVPSDARRALACARLRQQGTKPASLPAACRPDR